MKKEVYAGFDIGGTKILTVLADHRCSTFADEGPEAILCQIKNALNQVLDKAGVDRDRLLKAGVCIAGYFDATHRLLVHSPNIPGWNHFPLEEKLSSWLDVPVWVENDANAAALGETYEGAAKGKTEVVYVTVSTGIGAGLICRGKIYRGSLGFAGEIGHMKVKPGGATCGCGGRGCLETVASGTAIARKARQAIESGQFIKGIGSAEALTTEDVFEAVQTGDKVAQTILREAIQYLGMGLANAVNLLNPQIIVVGGGVVKAGKALLEPLEKEIRKNAVPALAKDLVLKKAALGSASGVKGMIHLLRQGER